MIQKYEQYQGGDDRPLLDFALFAASTYYPSEGVQDLVASGDTIAGLFQLVSDEYDWWQIVEVATLKVVLEGSPE